jgi:hypothetical protein
MSKALGVAAIVIFGLMIARGGNDDANRASSDSAGTVATKHRDPSKPIPWRTGVATEARLA